MSQTFITKLCTTNTFIDVPTFAITSTYDFHKPHYCKCTAAKTLSTAGSTFQVFQERHSTESATACGRTKILQIYLITTKLMQTVCIFHTCIFSCFCCRLCMMESYILVYTEGIFFCSLTR